MVNGVSREHGLGGKCTDFAENNTAPDLATHFNNDNEWI